jgi:hypothetical protein
VPVGPQELAEKFLALVVSDKTENEKMRLSGKEKKNSPALGYNAIKPPALLPLGI